MPEKLYKKVGKKFLPVKLWEGFPAEGVWIVKKGRHGRSERLVKPLEMIDKRLGDVPSVPVLAAFERHHEAIDRALMQSSKYGGLYGGLCITDITTLVIRTVALAEEKERGCGICETLGVEHEWEDERTW